MANIGEFTGDILPGAMQSAASIKYRFAVMTGTTRAASKITRAGNGVLANGIMTDGGDAVGATTGIAINGVGYLEVDGNAAAIAVNDFLDPDAAGKGTKNALTNTPYSAIALEPSAADGDVIKVAIIQGYVSSS